MSDKKQRKVLVPQYMNKFRCIGSKCEDTCCIGWNVTIDKKTYQNYRSCNDKDLKVKFKDKVKRNRTNPSELNYAKIKLNQDESCPFLDDKKLCSIQCGLGEEYLSLTCTEYPRVFNKVDNILEKSATISCPEVARIILLNPQKMEFDEIYEDVRIRNFIKQTIDINKFDSLNKPVKYFWQLRIFTISLLQKRNLKLWERLIILGFFYEKVEEYIKERKSKEIPNLIAKYTSMIDNGVFDGMLDNIPTQTTLQMKILKELIDERVYRGVSSKRYVECLNECLHGIGYIKGVDMKNSGNSYKDNYEKYYYPYMSKKEYILENYLVNYVFENLSPFNGKRTVFENYVIMIIHYSLIKLNLIGMIGYHKEKFCDEHIIKLIQSFAKTVEHNDEFLNHINELLKKNNATSMAYMSILIKN